MCIRDRDNIKIYMSRPSLFDIPDDVQIRFNDSDIVTGGRGSVSYTHLLHNVFIHVKKSKRKQNNETPIL